MSGTRNVYQDISTVQMEHVQPTLLVRIPSPKRTANLHMLLEKSRLMKKMTVNDLATISRLSSSSIKKFECGELVPDICAMKVLECVLTMTSTR